MSKLHINISPKAIRELYDLPVVERNIHAHGIFKRIVEVESYKWHVSNTTLDIDDLQSVGYTGLFKALNTYIIGQGSFVSYCWHYISGYMSHYSSKHGKYKKRHHSSIDSTPTSGDIEDLVIDNVGLDDSTVRGITISSDIAYILPLMQNTLTKLEFDVLIKMYVDEVPERVIARLLKKGKDEVTVIVNRALSKVRTALSKERV